VIKRNRDTDTIAVIKFESLANILRIIENIVMAECDGFGIASGAARELNVGHILKCRPSLSFSQDFCAFYATL